MSADPLAHLEDRVQYRFKNKDLLRLALTHSSLDADGSQNEGNYQRLEFLGDRVLGLVICEALYKLYPNADEGDLARRLNNLVRKETCAQIAEKLDFGSSIFMGMTEAMRGGRKRTAMLGDVCESVIAALYLDGGLEVARGFIETSWHDLLRETHAVRPDAKTALQEWAQARGEPLPVYQLIKREGPDHAPVFQIAARVEDGRSASGQGSSKRNAEQSAAGALLAILLPEVWATTDG